MFIFLGFEVCISSSSSSEPEISVLFRRSELKSSHRLKLWPSFQHERRKIPDCIPYMSMPSSGRTHKTKAGYKGW